METWIDLQYWSEQWVNVESLVSGGQGDAKKVRCQDSDQIAFLKLLSRKNDDERRSRFFREATAYDTCMHPNIPRLLQSNAHKHVDKTYRLFIVTEFIPGPTIRDWVDKFGPLTFEQAATTLGKLLRTVEYIHSQGWVHRDIKPDNIIFRNNAPSDPVLLDFGLSYKDGVLAGFETDHCQEIGNRFLRLPELSASSQLKQDLRSDLAFLGGIFVYVLTAVEPCTLVDANGQMPHQRADVVERLVAGARNVLYPLLSFFDRTFAQKISERFGSACEMEKALDKVVERMNGTAETSSPDSLEAIVEALHTKVNADLVRNKKLYDRVMDAIGAVHQNILERITPTYLSYQTGYLNFADGLRNGLGFSHFANINIRFVPSFLIKVIGEELVVLVDNQPLYRTDITSPKFDDGFREAVSMIFVRGLRGLLNGDAVPNIGAKWFRSSPYRQLSDARREASLRGVPIFAIIYNDASPTYSKLDYSLGYFLEYSTTKDLIDEMFVAALLPNSDQEVRTLVPDDDPLENARWVILSPKGEVLRSETVYANPDEGLRRVREVIAQWKQSE